MNGEGGRAPTGEVALVPSTADAVSASVACARAMGLPFHEPEIIAEGYSVRIRLRPAPVVTRVVTLGRQLRPDSLPWLEREVPVAGFLAASGVPIVPPVDGAGATRRRRAGGLLVALGRP